VEENFLTRGKISRENADACVLSGRGQSLSTNLTELYAGDVPTQKALSQPAQIDRGARER
jgi:hypothetical protein